tara:strand:+ start:1150 stop:1725 length:576 start_codon:yes stop_codon:yes gene_type:complete
MAIIPNGQKFHTVSADVDTNDKGSARSNADREVYTMQDVIDTVGGGGGAVTELNGTEAEYKVRSSAVSAPGEIEGAVVKFGATTGMNAGQVYAWNGTNWVQVDADAENTTKGLLGVALGASSASDGLLTHGVAYLNHNPGSAGDTLYIHTTQGQLSSTQPGAGKFVRVAGYCLDNNKVFFSPSQDYIEVSP